MALLPFFAALCISAASAVSSTISNTSVTSNTTLEDFLKVSTLRPFFIQQTFARLDTDSDGHITLHEFRNGTQQLQKEKLMLNTNFSADAASEPDRAFRRLDDNNDGLLDASDIGRAFDVFHSMSAKNVSTFWESTSHIFNRSRVAEFFQTPLNMINASLAESRNDLSHRHRRVKRFWRQLGDSIGMVVFGCLGSFFAAVSFAAHGAFMGYEGSVMPTAEMQMAYNMLRQPIMWALRLITGPFLIPIVVVFGLLAVVFFVLTASYFIDILTSSYNFQPWLDRIGLGNSNSGPSFGGSEAPAPPPPPKPDVDPWGGASGRTQPNNSIALPSDNTDPPHASSNASGGGVNLSDKDMMLIGIVGVAVLAVVMGVTVYFVRNCNCRRAPAAATGTGAGAMVPYAGGGGIPFVMNISPQAMTAFMRQNRNL